MTSLFLNNYSTYSVERPMPRWMREERYNYCEQLPRLAQTSKSLWNRFLNLFR